MVVALLACLAATVATGIVAYGEAGKGPLATERAVVVTTAYAEENELGGAAVETEGSKGQDSAIGELHAALAKYHPGACDPPCSGGRSG